MYRCKFLLILGVMSAVLIGCDNQNSSDSSHDHSVSEQPKQLTVYSSRKEHLIRDVFARYTKETGIEIRYITDKEAALIARLQAEGQQTPADIFLTVDGGNLWRAEQLGLLTPVKSAVLETNVPEHFRAENGSWYGLSLRARTMVYNTDRVQPNELNRYEDLAESPWQNRLCLRTSKKIYNQSLVASLISASDEANAEAIVKGWVSNLAVAPTSNDTQALKAVAQGVCDVTIVNTYYFARLMAEDPTLPLKIFWPNQQDRGVHVNISGAGVIKSSKYPEAATAFLEWLSSDKAQNDFADINREYPVNNKVLYHPDVEAWGEFRYDNISVEQLGKLQVQAVQLMDRAGYQ